MKNPGICISQVSKVNFTKFQGAGNDFIIVSDLEERFVYEDKEIIQKLCHRQLGVGADGLILVQLSSIADYRMRIFNPDGLEARMCGNGLRCLVGYLYLCLGRKEREFHIESLNGIHLCYREGDKICTSLGKPLIKTLSTTLNQEGELHIIDTGVPHAIKFVKNLQDESFTEKSRFIRHHSAFFPEGVNVNFAYIDEDEKVLIRTYERGVEEETLACGTGAAAVAVAARLLYKLKNPIQIVSKSKETLVCSLEESLREIVKISLLGCAKYVFDGQVDLDQL